MNILIKEKIKVEVEEILYNENRTPSQPPWFLVHENDSVAEHWGRIADRIVSVMEHLLENTCPECGDYKPDDERVQNGMKCGQCSY